MTIKTNIKKLIQDKLIIGWQEWCSLPELHLPAIKAKIDTGAKTSSLHAFNIKVFHRGDDKFVRFDIHPIQGNNDISVHCTAKVVDRRYVMSSNGHREHRHVIKTPIVLGDQTWDIEITLSNRDPMKFRMLLGREALNHKTLILPDKITCQKKQTAQQMLNLYQKR